MEITTFGKDDENIRLTYNHDGSVQNVKNLDLAKNDSAITEKFGDNHLNYSRLGTISSTTFTLLSATLGVGMLAIPRAFCKGGLSLIPMIKL